MSLRCLLRAAFVLVAAASSLACNQILGIHELRDDDAGTPVISVPDGGQDARVEAGSSRPDGSTVDAGDAGPPTTCNPGDQRCSPMGQVIQQCDLLGTWRDTMICPYACTGSGATTACSGSCKPGDQSCGDSNTPLLCNAMGENEAKPACPALCVDGACTGECKPYTTRCVSGSPSMFQICDAMGKWAAADACTFVCDAATGTCTGECSPGMANRCSGNAVQSCDATGHWVNTTTCTAVPCSGGQCRACMANEKQCNAGKPQTCSAAGVWVDDQATACPFLCDATTGKCVGECVPGADLCTAQVSKHCGTNGIYGAGTTCPNICDMTTGRCGGVCAPGAHRCNGAASQTCGANGQWGADASCPFGCSTTSGQCNACTDEAMTVTCGGGKCGPTVNNCMHTVMCATTCAGTGETCGGGGVTGVCGCRPETLAQTCGTHCGSMTNNCGQQVTCTTTCTAPQTCGGGGTANVCGCTPKTATVACTGKNCGSVSDGCTGTVTCGACTAPQTCSGGGTANVCGCTPMAAAAACGTRTCGTAPNGCGGTVNCGSMNGGCPTGMVCNSNGTCASTCTPLTACPAGKNCGTIDNGCGTGTLTCGTMAGGCPASQTCGGGGTANVCGCTPVPMTSVCGGVGKNCGTVPNGCGGTFTCGTCSSPQSCGGGGTANVCGCMPMTVAQACTAAGKNCGTVDNGCGGTVACGNCAAPNTCGGGGTGNVCGCTPLTQPCTGGRNCGTAPNGCGVNVSCGTCATNEMCSAGGVCTCVPKTAAAACGTHDCGTASDGCGVNLNCGPLAGACPSGKTCISGVCTCVPMTVAQACTMAGKNCGMVPDGCGTGGTVNCGTCTIAGQTCGGGNPSMPNVCGCFESDTAFCTRLGKTCGTVMGTDNCRVSRTVNCGTCSSGCCGGSNTCVTTQTATQCGATGQTCRACPAPPANATATCSSAGACGFTCNPGFTGAQCEFPRLQAVPLPSGDTSSAFSGISADGAVVAAASNTQAFVWVPGGAVTNVFPTAGGERSFVHLSPDGQIVVGCTVFLDSQNLDASDLWMWTRSNGAVRHLQAPPLVDANVPPHLIYTACPNATSSAAAGPTIVGAARDVLGEVDLAFYWSPASGFQIFDALYNEWDANGVSPDGSLAVGAGSNPTNDAILWRRQGATFQQATALSSPRSACGEAAALSGNGAVILGTDCLGLTTWTGSGFGTPNFLTSGGTVLDKALASATGGTIVGQTFTGGVFQAVISINGGPVQPMSTVLAAAGADLSTWGLTSARGVTSDGKIVVGDGILNGVARSWIARLP